MSVAHDEEHHGVATRKSYLDSAKAAMLFVRSVIAVAIRRHEDRVSQRNWRKLLANEGAT
jgi:hypothetical protein